MPTKPANLILRLHENFGGNRSDALLGARKIFASVRDTPCLKPFGRLGGHTYTKAEKAMRLTMAMGDPKLSLVKDEEEFKV